MPKDYFLKDYFRGRYRDSFKGYYQGLGGFRVVDVFGFMGLGLRVVALLPLVALFGEGVSLQHLNFGRGAAAGDFWI